MERFARNESSLSFVPVSWWWRSVMSEFLRRVRWLFHRTQFENDLDEEMQHHLSMKGHQQFGNIVLLKENSRAMWTFVFWEQFAQDIRYGLRNMATNKLFTAM